MRRSIMVTLATAILAGAAPVTLNDMVTTHERAPVRWAVLVGINDYAAFDGIEEGDLRGAVNDARSMYDVLIGRWGFAEENIKILLDSEATKDGIQSAVTEWLAGNVQEGDIALFFYAGHGSQTFDEGGDEPDGLDEIIAPHDVTLEPSDRDITDDELAEWFSKIPTREVIVIFDSCHSGTATRGLSTRARPRSIKRDLPATGTRGDATEAAAMASEFVQFELAAAASNQVAMDWVFAQERGQVEYAGGAFTTHLVRQLWRAKPGETLKMVFDQTSESMKADRFDQDPQFAGPQDRPVFNLDAGSAMDLAAGQVSVPPTAADLFSVPDPSTPIHETATAAGTGGAELMLSAGASFGVTPGSLYTMGEGLVRVVEVRQSQSVVVPVAGTPSYTGFAWLVATMPRSTGISVNMVDVPAALRTEVSRLVDADRINTNGGDDADLYLKASAQGFELVSRGDALRAVIGASDGETAATVADALRQELASRSIATLDNPAAEFGVTVGFVDGKQEFRIRDPLAFTVTSEVGGYLTLVDLGTDGTVTVLYPNRYVPDGRVEAGKPLEIPTAEMPFRLRASAPSGWGMVRALVTPEPLVLPATDEPLLARKEGERLAQEVVDALRASLASGWTQQVPLGRALPVAGWATSLVNYRVIQ